MQNYAYSVLSIVAIAIHLIINFDIFPGRRGSGTAYGLRYRGFLAGLFAYYVTDACWGVLAGLGWTRALYVDTVLYFIAMSVSVLTWCRYVIAYLNFSRGMSKALYWFGYWLLGMFVVLMVVNAFNGCVFSFDDQGRYTPGVLRNFIFYVLVVLNALMAVSALVKALGGREAVRRRNMVVFLFCLTMAVAIVIQIAWPLWPFYALGCLVGSCFFHVFVVEDEREELRRAVIAREEAAKHAAAVESAQERARVAEKARSMFFSIVSHDIRTPLNAIIGYSELLQFGIKNKAERDTVLKSIRASGTTLLQLVNDVLDISRIDAGELVLQPEPVRISALVDDVFSSFGMVAAEKGITLENLTGGVPTVLLDGHRFRQIFFNLIGNAVKFTDRGKVSVATSCSGTGIEVSVSDTGCGIPPSLLAHIFDPFVQAQDPTHSADRAGGTGLGLTICSRLVKAMGGELDVKSEVGKGSTFRARIPGVVAAGDRAVAEPKPAVAPKNLPKRVLVVDDSSINRDVLAMLLAHIGVTSVEQACDGIDAMSELEAAHKAGQAYDFVFSDLWMPKMNGIELIEKLRADPRFGSIPVCAVTADAEFLRDERCALFNGILLKPLTYDKLVDVFADAMR